jgi:hypothetical protein
MSRRHWSRRKSIKVATLIPKGAVRQAKQLHKHLQITPDARFVLVRRRPFGDEPSRRIGCRMARCQRDTQRQDRSTRRLQCNTPAKRCSRNRFPTGRTSKRLWHSIDLAPNGIAHKPTPARKSRSRRPAKAPAPHSSTQKSVSALSVCSGELFHRGRLARQIWPRHVGLRPG